MIKGDKFTLLRHEMEVIEKKETLDVEDGKARDLFIYDIACTCHTYPKQLTMTITQDDLEVLQILDGFDEDE